jgi:hypothetical protein
MTVALVKTTSIQRLPAIAQAVMAIVLVSLILAGAAESIESALPAIVPEPAPIEPVSRTMASLSPSIGSESVPPAVGSLAISSRAATMESRPTTIERCLGVIVRHLG